MQNGVRGGRGSYQRPCGRERGPRLTGPAEAPRIPFPFGGSAHHGQNETHVPAQQPSPEQDARVPDPDENQAGPCRSCPPPGERAQAPLRLSGGDPRNRRSVRGVWPEPCTRRAAPHPAALGAGLSRGLAASGLAGTFGMLMNTAPNSTAASWSCSRVPGRWAGSGSASRPRARRAGPCFATGRGGAFERSSVDGRRRRLTLAWTSS